VQGEGFAGAPYVILGQTRDIAWGATTNPMDVTDTYVEQVLPDSTSPSGLSTVYQGRLEHVVAIPETFRVNQRTPGGVDRVVPVPPGNGVPATTLIVPRRNNGPIVAFDSGSGTALSVQYTGFSPTRELDSSGCSIPHAPSTTSSRPRKGAWRLAGVVACARCLGGERPGRPPVGAAICSATSGIPSPSVASHADLADVLGCGG
jgi:acyl-homoserine lactone acylase PvdQ